MLHAPPPVPHCYKSELIWKLVGAMLRVLQSVSYRRVPAELWPIVWLCSCSKEPRLHKKTCNDFKAVSAVLTRHGVLKAQAGCRASQR
jgi:hypothetical protein